MVQGKKCQKPMAGAQTIAAGSCWWFHILGCQLFQTATLSGANSVF
jgi:hypothetical protein